MPWLLAVVVPVLFPEEGAFGTQVLVMMLFALSLDFILGYAGIVTLGHAAYFGLGAYAAGLLSKMPSRTFSATRPKLMPSVSLSG